MGDSSRWDAEVSADEADEADAWDDLLGPSADRQRRERLDAANLHVVVSARFRFRRRSRPVDARSAGCCTGCRGKGRPAGTVEAGGRPTLCRADTGAGRVGSA